MPGNNLAIYTEIKNINDQSPNVSDSAGRRALSPRKNN
jgi:hypothetical protein